MGGSALQTPAPDTAPTLKSPATDAQQHCCQSSYNTAIQSTMSAIHDELSMCRAGHGTDKPNTLPLLLPCLLHS